MNENSGMKASDAARQTRASYDRLLRRQRGIPPSSMLNRAKFPRVNRASFADVRRHR